MYFDGPSAGLPTEWLASWCARWLARSIGLVRFFAHLTAIEEGYVHLLGLLPSSVAYRLTMDGLSWITHGNSTAARDHAGYKTYKTSYKLREPM